LKKIAAHFSPSSGLTPELRELKSETRWHEDAYLFVK